MSAPLVAIVSRQWALSQIAGSLMGTGVTTDEAMMLAATELDALEQAAEPLVDLEVSRLAGATGEALLKALQEIEGEWS